MRFGFYYFDTYYLILVLPALLISLWAQFMVKSTFAKYSKIPNGARLTGAQAARDILDKNGLYQIRVEPIQGELTDHYDPRADVIRLSTPVFSSGSVAAIGVAAHEAGHAVQHGVGYFPIKLRNAVIPITRIGSNLSIPLILLGAIFSVSFLIDLGILLFGAMFLFQVITLPVEFNASRRAIATLEGSGMLTKEELSGARKVLTAAAMTYVAAMLLSLAQLLRLVAIYGGRGKRND